MPSQAANAASARADGYKPRLLLSDLSGSVTATVSVDITPEDGALELTVTLLTGTIFAIAFPGMRIEVHSAGGDYKGAISVGYRGVTSATVIQIRELSPGEVKIVAGDILTIYDDLIPADKLVSATLTFEPDSDTYIDQTDEYSPLCCSGGANVGRLVGGVFDSPFYGSPSILVDPDSSTPVTHVWTGTGTPSFIVGSSTVADPTMRWTAAGKKLVRHIVTDPDNGETSSQWMQVRIHDDNDPPYEIVLSSPPTGTPESGFSFAFTLFDNPSVANLRDNAHVVLWSDDTIAGGAAFGSKVPGRSHIVAEGYLRRDSGELGDGVNGVTFEVISPIAKLAELPGFSKVFERNQTPASWNQWRSLTVFRALYGLLIKYTNIGDIFDIILDGFSDANYPLLYVQKQNPFEQVMELAESRSARLTCDRTGRLELQGLLQSVPLASRGAITKTFTFTGADSTPPLILKRDHVRPLETFKLRGFVAGTAPTTEEGTTAPAFARYPATPARGGQVIIEERRIVDDASSDLFVQCSLSAAWANADYFDADGNWQHAPELTATFPLVYARMFQNYREYCAFNVTAMDEYGRQVDLSVFDWIPMSITEDYDALTCKVVFRAATYALPEMSVDDTPSTENTLPPYVPPTVPPITSPTPLPGAISYAINRMALIMAGGLAWTLNFQSSYPNWNFLAWGSFGVAVTGTVLLWVPDGFAPGSGWLFTTTRIYRLVIGTQTATLLHTWSATCQSVSADASFSEQGFVCAVAYIQGTGSVAARSTDGVTFTEVTITANYATDGASFGIQNGCFVSSRIAGRVLTSVYTSTAAIAGIARAGRESLDYGATWGVPTAPTITPGVTLAATIHVPWHDNPTESIAYYSHIATVGSDHRTYRANGASITDVSPEVAGADYCPRPARDGICSNVGNRQRMLTISQTESAGSTYAGFLANDAGGLWANYLGDGSNARGCALAGDDLNTGWDWGLSAYIRQLSISGNTVIANSKTGDLATYSTSTVIAIAGY